MTGPTAAARETICTDHAELVDDIAASADALAATWTDPPTDRAAVVPPFEALLDQRGVLSALPAVLTDAVAAAGYELRATPVAGPPYVVVTSTGVVCRATVADGRLVVRFRCFAVDRDGDGPARYVRRDGGPAQLVDVSFRDA
ncbi:hypothetical protein [Haloarchaeobius sp. DFWS5]|uniref:hypothetical protein n=1 Tax=Haloarchaeobius sp. DFWS5 TaxID=3446114 RepID=UPI003EBFCC0F